MLIRWRCACQLGSCYQSDYYQIVTISAVDTYIHPLIKWHVHALGLPFPGADTLYIYMPLEEVLQNEAVGMNFSIDTILNSMLHPR